MGKITVILFVFIFLFSCGNKEKKNTSVTPRPVAENADTSMIALQDTFDITKEPETEIVSSKVDECFEDFIFNFASNPDLQLKRILFPLTFYKQDVSSAIEKKAWDMDSLFINENYYTLLLDQEEDMEKLGDTSHSSIQIEWLDMPHLMQKRYYFERMEGKWMLEAIDERPIVEGMKRDFVDFFYKFANDSVFQCAHTRNPLEFITVDPDDDFAVLETTLDYDQWQAFKPLLPLTRLSNINYGQKNEDNSQHKILQLKGVGNGFLNTLFFCRKNNTWELYRFEDTNN